VWAAPAGAASRSRFYRLTDDDRTTHQRVEHYLSRVESHAATAIRHLCADPAGVSAPDRATIAMFLALLEGRTIAGLEQLSNLADLTLQTMHASHCAEPSPW
jgi:ABC-type siderophore export system fused ATPase/permease subunit